MIIGLTGQLQAGKDTVADHLVEHYGFTKMGFSDKLYECVCTLFGITIEQALRFKEEGVEVHLARPKEWPMVTLTEPITMRTILQRMGTDVGRDIIDPDLWVNLFVGHVMILDAEDHDNVADIVVRDVRFNNEAAAIRSADFDSSIWRIIRPGFDGDSHASEAGISDELVDMEIMNGSSLDYLYQLVDETMEEQYGRKRISAAHG